jgi:alpha-glucosidase (family GH31 glycosyl hydrolase)
MFGDALLVAPILERDQMVRDVYLPLGSSWMNVWTGKEIAGGQIVSVDAPYGNIPVFLRDEKKRDLDQFLELAGKKNAFELSVSSD